MKGIDLPIVWDQPGDNLPMLSDFESEAMKSDRTNIVRIIAGDLGYGDLGCYGQRITWTPRLDGLARESITKVPENAALKTYLNLGFLPVYVDADQPERWRRVFGILGVESIPDQACSSSSTVYRRAVGLRRRVLRFSEQIKTQWKARLAVGSFPMRIRTGRGRHVEAHTIALPRR